MKKYFILMILAAAILLVACEEKKPVESAQGLMTEDGRFIIRSASVLREDPYTKKILTTQESHQIGTRLSIGIYDDAEVPGHVFDELFLLVDALDQVMSKNIEGTEVDQINQMAGVAPVVVSDKLLDLIEKALTYTDMSSGLFDITIGAVVNLWDIGTADAKVPDPSALEEAVKKVGSDKLIVSRENQTVYLEEVGMVLDLGGIAKGLIADEVGQLVRILGYDSAILNFGGDVLAVGSKPEEKPWVVGVRDPYGSGIIGSVRAVDASVVSSGVYERFFIEDDIRYHHIINPETGFPEQNELLSTTLLTKTAADGDALSTAVFLLGVEEGLKFVNAHEGMEAILVTLDKKVYVTDGLKNDFHLTDETYTLEP